MSRWIDVEGIGWTCEQPGSRWAAAEVIPGRKFVLERRRRNLKDGSPDTGWYLYGPDIFGEFMGRTFKAAASEALQIVSDF